MKKGDSGEKWREKTEKRLMRIVATTSLPAVDRRNDTNRKTTVGTPHARANLEITRLLSPAELGLG